MNVEIQAATSPTARPAPDLARVFKALGDPTRLAIFALIRSHADTEAGHTSSDLANTVSQIASQFDVSLSTVSHHLKELRGAGLIRCERRGQSIYCSVETAVLADVERFSTGQ
jgi:DNA-binding transcriptional ArsR family regulator